MLCSLKYKQLLFVNDYPMWAVLLICDRKNDWALITHQAKHKMTVETIYIPLFCFSLFLWIKKNKILTLTIEIFLIAATDSKKISFQKETVLL